MTGAETLDVATDAITTLLIMVAPPMAIALGVGLAIAFFQALTQIQEMTLTFVPKIIAIFVTLLLTLPMMAAAMQAFMLRIVDRIATG